ERRRRVPQPEHVRRDVQEHGGDRGVAVRHVAEEGPEDRPRGARELVHEAGTLRDLEQAQPERHHADEADGERHGISGAFQSARADRLRIAAYHRRDERGDEEEDEDDVHPQRAWHETVPEANLRSTARGGSLTLILLHVTCAASEEVERNACVASPRLPLFACCSLSRSSRRAPPTRKTALRSRSRNRAPIV